MQTKVLNGQQPVDDKDEVEGCSTRVCGYDLPFILRQNGVKNLEFINSKFKASGEFDANFTMTLKITSLPNILFVDLLPLLVKHIQTNPKKHLLENKKLDSFAKFYKSQQKLDMDHQIA